MKPRILFAAVLLSLSGCASVPTGPSVMALPGSGRSFEQFRYDESDCRQYAREQTGVQTGRELTPGFAVLRLVP